MPSAFDQKSAPPDDAALSRTLGPAKKAWDATLSRLRDLAGGIEVDWRFYGAKHGWQLKATRKKKAVLYLIPHEGKFVAATALPADVVARLDDADLPAALVAEIRAAKAYAEGTPARVEVTGTRQLRTIERLLALKLG